LTQLITLQEWSNRELGTGKKPRSLAKTSAGSNKYAIAVLEQVSRKEAGVISWHENKPGVMADPKNKPGFFGGKLIAEGSLRKCEHCGQVWTYQPGSGKLVGYCYRCDGFKCWKPSCQDCYPQEQFVEDLELTSAPGIAGAFGPTRKVIEALVRQQNWRNVVFCDRPQFRSPL
jgi:hypothetical protein